jgi:hypothetical protein
VRRLPGGSFAGASVAECRLTGEAAGRSTCDESASRYVQFKEMKRWLMFLFLAATLSGALTASGLAAVRKPSVLPLPRWLMPAEIRTLDRGFGGARPTTTWYKWYPRKIAVIFEFRHVVICGACSAPSNASLPRGRVIRVSYDRQTHREGGSLMFCESKGSFPPLSRCLRR